MRYKFFIASILITLLVSSCIDNPSKNSKTINQSTKPLNELKNLVAARGDTSAYYDLFYEYVDRDKQNSDFFYYAYVMAFKYNYPKAYMDVFDILCNIYNIKIDGNNTNLKSMDEKTKEIAITCLKRASDLHYLDVETAFNKLIKEVYH